MFKTNLRNKLAALAVMPAVVLASSPALAAIDVTAATTGIADAQTAVLAVLGTLFGFILAVWGIRRVMRLFGTGR